MIFTTIRRTVNGTFLRKLPVTSQGYLAISRQQVARYKAEPPKYSVDDPQIGDYPNLPMESRLKRPPLGWWDQQNRRDFGELLHEEEEALSVWGFDVYGYDPSTSLKQLSLFFLSVGVLTYVVAKTMPERPA
ncbi:482_t:CDS:2, partial [Acaulospora morrowiae]